MLVDPTFTNADPIIAMLASLNNGPSTPQRIDKGLYLASHWNVGYLAHDVRNRWQEDEYSELSVPENGVCDSPEQLLEKIDFEAIPEPVFISFVRINRDDEPRSGGWRWHKWGKYIGNHDPKYEYLHDEPDIDHVYTFSVHELKA